MSNDRPPTPYRAIGLSPDEFMEASAILAKCGISADDLTQAARAAVRAAETFTHPTTPTAANKAAKPSPRTQKEQL